jgi:hypothetical protein
MAEATDGLLQTVTELQGIDWVGDWLRGLQKDSTAWSEVVGWLVGWLCGWLVDWLVGWLFTQLSWLVGQLVLVSSDGWMLGN